MNLYFRVDAKQPYKGHRFSRIVTTEGVDMGKLNESELVHLPDAISTGVPDKSEIIEVSVILNPRTAIGSAVAHKRLTREQFVALHGADPLAIASIEAFATQKGLKVVTSDDARRTVVLSGSLGAMESAFGVRFATYKAGELQYRGYEGAIELPQEILSAVVAVMGLSDRPAAEPRFCMAESGELDPRLLGGPYMPPDVAIAYNFPTGVDGSGQCIGIIELGGGYHQTDIQLFFSQLGLPSPNIVAVSVDGGSNSPGLSNNNDIEVGLDIQVAGSIAPKATIAVYFAPNTVRGFLDAITTAIYDPVHRPSVISISWGRSEDSWSGGDLSAFDLAFQAAGSMGVTVFTASGDHGSSDNVSDSRAHVDFPSSSPNVIGCGGTTLIANGGTIQSEVVWNNGIGATGGGVSDRFALPIFQLDAGVPGSVNPSHYTGRGVPDVAGNADPQTGYKCIIDGQPLTIGGTSAVAPLWAGLTALINSAYPAPVGSINFELYNQDNAFRPILSGNNGAYKAGPGWNPCCGLGSPDGQILLTSLAPYTAVYHQGDPGNGIGGYDLKSHADSAFAFDYDGSGKLDHLVLYRPGTGTIWILKKNADGSFAPVPRGESANGIGGYDLKSPADSAFAFDYDSSGKLDHLVLCRPGTGIIWILKKNADGSFAPVPRGESANGIGGYDLKSPADSAFAFDYNSSGKLDHLVLYRPGTGTIWILKKLADGSFVPVYHQGDPGNGIGGYDLKSPFDRAFAFDYDSSGKLDHLVLYRPGTGTIWILKKNADGSFVRVYHQGDPGNGIGGYDLKSPFDRAFAFDYDSSGKLDHLSLYRPGTGTIWILKKHTDNLFIPIYLRGDPGNGIGGYDLKSPFDRVFAFDYAGIGKLDHLSLYRPGAGTIWILQKG